MISNQKKSIRHTCHALKSCKKLTINITLLPDKQTGFRCCICHLRKTSGSLLLVQFIPLVSRAMMINMMIFDDVGDTSYEISHQRHYRCHRHHHQYHCSSASRQHQHHIMISIIVKRFISWQQRRAPVKRKQNSRSANTKR